MFSGLIDSITKFWWNIVYGLTRALAWILGLLYDLFEIAIGLDNVDYDGSSNESLLEVIFGHSMISHAYWAIAAVGIALCFFFTIISVIRKMFDNFDEVKESLGQILTRSFKSILTICCMTLFMSMVLKFSTTLMQTVQLAFFSSSEVATESNPKTYSKEEYATMARVMNTIGNYSLNPSYNSRYNINSCYNAIRSDLVKLNTEGTFAVRYETPDALTNKEHYWQEALQKIVIAAPTLTEDVPLDVNNETLTTAITNVMNEIKNDKQFQPLEKYALAVSEEDTAEIHLDRIILLVGTFNAANDGAFNGENASFTDMVRGAYYYSESGHDLYDNDDMWKSFDLSEYNYVVVIFITCMLIYNMAEILMSAIARMFNMVVMYIIAPPFIATAPLDGGSKFKQWRTSFLVQCFSVFGTLVAMDVTITFIPIIMSGQLKLFSNPVLNWTSKLVIVWGAFVATKKASNLVSGILAENASMTAADSLKTDGAGGALRSAVATATGLKMVGALPGMAASIPGMIKDNMRNRLQEALPFGKSKGGSNSGGAGGDINQTNQGGTGGKDGGSGNDGNDATGTGADGNNGGSGSDGNDGGGGTGGVNETNQGGTGGKDGGSGNDAKGTGTGSDAKGGNGVKGGTKTAGTQTNGTKTTGTQTTGTEQINKSSSGGKEGTQNNQTNNNDTNKVAKTKPKMPMFVQDYQNMNNKK